MKFWEFMNENIEVVLVMFVMILTLVLFISFSGIMVIIDRTSIKKCYEVCEKSDNITQCIATCNNVESKEKK